VIVHVLDETWPGYEAWAIAIAEPHAVGTVWELPGGVTVKLVAMDESSDTATVEVTAPEGESAPVCHDGTPVRKVFDEPYDVSCSVTSP
jgi:hypothetical protein